MGPLDNEQNAYELSQTSEIIMEEHAHVTIIRDGTPCVLLCDGLQQNSDVRGRFQLLETPYLKYVLWVLIGADSATYFLLACSVLCHFLDLFLSRNNFLWNDFRHLELCIQEK